MWVWLIFAPFHCSKPKTRCLTQEALQVVLCSCPSVLIPVLPAWIQPSRTRPSLLSSGDRMWSTGTCAQRQQVESKQTPAYSGHLKNPLLRMCKRVIYAPPRNQLLRSVHVFTDHPSKRKHLDEFLRVGSQKEGWCMGCGRW